MFEEEPDVVDLAKDSSAFPVYSSSLISVYSAYYYIWASFEGPTCISTFFTKDFKHHI